MTAEVVDPATGEVIVLDKSAARVRADLIRDGLDDLWTVITEAYAARDWLALGYSTWDIYCDAEFRDRRLALPREERDGVVGSLREAGMTVRAISAATGASVGTVHAALSGVQDRTPDRVTGRDGKSYQPTRPEPVSDAPLPPRPDWVKPSAERVEEKRRQAIADRAFSILTAATTTHFIHHAEAIADGIDDRLDSIFREVGVPDQRAFAFEQLTALRDACDRALSALGPTHRHLRSI